MSKYKFSLLISIIFSIILSACSQVPAENDLDLILPVPTVTPTISTGQHNYPWWNDVVFYEIFVRSFSDSDGDGIGDFQGLKSKLDYLNDGDPNTKSDLGITGIWLMPIFPSTSYHGYDVIDYRDVNPEYGTMDDFIKFLEEAHNRNIKVIIDFVINHTSIEHPWFTEARADTESLYREWYIWSEDKPSYKGPWGQNIWHFNYDNTYYYGVFWSGMPDLNFRNNQVTEEVFDITDFWLKEVGVDGFRIDGALHLIEDGEVQKNTDATHEWFRAFNEHYKAINPQAMTVGEVWDSNFLAVRYVKDKEFDLVFDFEQADSILLGVMGSDGQRVLNALEFNYNLYPDFQKANFLTNHDMNRVMHVFQGNENKAKAAAVILLTSPGVPFIYYGEEVGMLGAKPDENIRLPMQWSTDLNAGFSTGTPWRGVNDNYLDWNMETLKQTSESLTNLYRTLIQSRNETIALRVGEYKTLKTNERNVIAYARVLDEEIIIIIINLENNEKNVVLDIPVGFIRAGEHEVISLLDSKEMASIKVIDEIPTTYTPKEIFKPWEYLILKIKL
ncbi:MAG: alpha-amylase [Chloroflexi bacterium HGW-Chloroflexi-3]|nr:MAG: alpha-amylase [Chloroflexi bacterium HGW-Chloroflexi-3]